MPPKLSKQEFIEKSSLVHLGKYDYSLVDYINNYTPVTIGCPIHKNFVCLPKTHMKGTGCGKCKNPNKIQNTHEFVARARKVHGEKYDYSRSEFINASTIMRIVCKSHGDFWQTSTTHLNGNGCKKCNFSHGERIVSMFLDKLKVKYETQFSIEGCENKSKLRFDFCVFIPPKPSHRTNTSLNLMFNIFFIEYDGIQHFKPIEAFGGVDGFRKTLARDEIKNEWCRKNHVPLLRISFDLPQIEVLNEIRAFLNV